MVPPRPAAGLFLLASVSGAGAALGSDIQGPSSAWSRAACPVWSPHSLGSRLSAGHQGSAAGVLCACLGPGSPVWVPRLACDGRSGAFSGWQVLRVGGRTASRRVRLGNNGELGSRTSKQRRALEEEGRVCSLVGLVVKTRKTCPLSCLQVDSTIVVPMPASLCLGSAERLPLAWLNLYPSGTPPHHVPLPANPVLPSVSTSLTTLEASWERNPAVPVLLRPACFTPHDVCKVYLCCWQVTRFPSFF